MNVKNLLPSFISFLSLSSGFLAIRETFLGNISGAVTLIIFACIFDLFDGKVARHYRVSSPAGVLVDSFCDFGNFGIICSLIVQLFWNFDYLILFPCIIYTVAVALRLIRFSINPANETNHFIGMSSPIAGILFLFPVFLINFIGFEKGFIMKFFTFFYCTFIALLPFSSIKMISNKSLGFVKRMIYKNKEAKTLFLISTLISFLSLIVGGFLLGIYMFLIFYVIFSFYLFYYQKVD